MLWIIYLILRLVFSPQVRTHEINTYNCINQQSQTTATVVATIDQRLCKMASCLGWSLRWLIDLRRLILFSLYEFRSYVQQTTQGYSTASSARPSCSKCIKRSIFWHIDLPYNPYIYIGTSNVSHWKVFPLNKTLNSFRSTHAEIHFLYMNPLPMWAHTSDR